MKFNLPPVPDKELIRKFRLNRNTKVVRNLKIRQLHRNWGYSFGKIASMSAFSDVGTPQNVERICKSPEYELIEEYYSLLDEPRQ